jgi:hypothetical protein
MKMSGDFNAKIVREDIFKPTIGNESLHLIINYNGVVNFGTSKYFTVKSTMFPHLNTHKYTWTTPHGKTHNQNDHILTDIPGHSIVLNVLSFKAEDSDADYYLVAEKFSDRLAVN